MKHPLALLIFFGLVSQMAFGDINAIVSQVKGALGGTGINGHTFKDGGLTVITNENCAELGSCAGNNPTSPYAAVTLPALPGEAVSTSPISKISWRLNKNEGVLLVGKTPSPMKYFGFTPYLMERKYKNARPFPIFGSLEDTLNSLTFSTQSGSPFDQEVAIVVTADVNMEQKIIGALTNQAGLGARAINKLPLPAKLPLVMGTGADADTFALFFRFALPESPEAFSTYLSNLPWKIVRITPNNTNSHVTEVETPALRKPGTNVCEVRGSGCRSVLVPNAKALSQEIVDKVAAVHSGSKIEELKVQHLPFEGRLCILAGLPCAGDNRDTRYFLDSSPVKLQKRSDDFLLIVGVDHAALNKVTYFNHGVYKQEALNGVGAFTSKNVVGSARYFTNNDSTEMKNMYAYVVSRDCGNNPYCFEVKDTGPLAIPESDPIFLLGRMYLEPTTKVKPYINELFIHRVFHISPNAQ